MKSSCWCRTGTGLQSIAQVTLEGLAWRAAAAAKTGTTRARLNEWLDPIEDEMTVSMELDSTEMIKRFVMADLGLSFLAASHCAEEVASKRSSRHFTWARADDPSRRAHLS